MQTKQQLNKSTLNRHEITSHIKTYFFSLDVRDRVTVCHSVFPNLLFFKIYRRCATKLKLRGLNLYGQKQGGEGELFFVHDCLCMTDDDSYNQQEISQSGHTNV